MDPSKRKKILVAAAIIFVTALFIAASVPIGKKLVELLGRPEEFRAWIDSRGFAGMLLYSALCLIQVVVAFIPGEPLEILGGYSFGAFWGSVLCLAGQMLGSVLVFFAVQKYKMRFFRIFFTEEKADKLRFLKETRKKDVLFLVIFALPGSPKDLLCYYAGLTDMSTGVFMIACSLGRLPAVLTSTIGGSALGSGRYVFAAVAFAVGALLSIAGLFAYNAFVKRREGKKEKEEESGT